MLTQISDILFMGSLILLIVTCITKGIGNRGMSSYAGSIDHTTGAATDLQMQHDHKKTMQTQDSVFGRLVRSYLFWISLTGILISVVLSKI